MKYRYHERLHRGWLQSGWHHQDRLPWGISAPIIIVLCLLLWFGIAALVHAVTG